MAKKISNRAEEKESQSSDNNLKGKAQKNAPNPMGEIKDKKK